MTDLATQKRTAGPLVLVVGLLLGLGWGVFARLWMRFISTDPEFSWSGTLFIVVGFGIGGLGQAAAYLGRRAQLLRARFTIVRVLGFVSLLPLGAAAGGPLFPVVILGALIWGHREWPSWVRWSLGASALLPVVGIARIITQELPPWRGMVGVVWLAVIYSVIIRVALFTLAPQRDGWEAPVLLRMAGFAATAAVAAMGALLLGAPS